MWFTIVKLAACVFDIAHTLKLKNHIFVRLKMSTRLFYLPPRGQLPACYLNPAHIISIFPDHTVFIYVELTNARRCSIRYESAEARDRALAVFVKSFAEPCAVEEHPKPVGGGIGII